MELDLKVIKRFFRAFYYVIIAYVIITAGFFGMSYFGHLSSTEHYIVKFQEELIRLISMDLNALEDPNEPPETVFQKYNSLHQELISNVLVVKPNGEAFFTTNVEKKYQYHGIGNKGTVQLDKLKFEDNLITTKRLDNNYEILVMTSNPLIKKMVFNEWITESRLEFSLSILAPIIILMLLKLIEDKVIKDLENKFRTYFNAFEDKSQETDELYKGLFRHNRCVMLLIDPQTGRVVEGNEAATAYYGYEFENQHIKITEINTMPPEELEKIIEDAVNKRRNYFNFQHKLANGMIRDVEAYSGPVIMSGKSLLCSIIHDVTDKIRAEQNLMNQQLEMEQRIQEKSEVLATISHEIRTPIAGIIHNINDLTSKIKDDDAIKQLQFLMLNVNSLNRLVFDLLDYSRIDAGGLKFYSTQFDLLEVLESSVELFKPVAIEKEIRIALHTEKLQHRFYVGDAFRIGQIVNNLISNSVKYTHNGSIDIEVTDEIMGHQSLVTIVVEDTGIGMNPEVVDQIFKRFYTTDMTGKLGGTGLGLAICRMIVEAMSGTLEVTSEEGIGTAMTLVLELDNDEGADLSLLQSQSKGAREYLNPNFFNKMTLNMLLVDDDPMSLIFIEKMLKQFSRNEINIDLAYNGQEAIELFKRNSYHCAFVDYQLPDIEGTRLIEALKTLSKNALKVVLMSAEQLDIKSEVIDAFMLKPIDTKALEQLMVQLFELKKAVNHTDNDIVIAQQMYLGSNVLENLLNYMEREDIQGVLEVFEHGISDKYEHLPAHLTKEDIPEVLKLLHALKGSISYFKAEQFLDILVMVDSTLRNDNEWTQIQSAYGVLYQELPRLIQEIRLLRSYIDQNFEVLF